MALLFIVLPSEEATAQSASLAKVNTAYLRKSGVIRSEDGITGYYFLTQELKIKMTGKKRNKETKTYPYLLTIMDQDLNTIGEKRFPAKPGFSVRSVAYNGTYLAIKMANWKTEKKWIELFDAEGNTVHRKGLRFGAYDVPKMQAGMAMFDLEDLIAVKDGFLNFEFSTGDKGKLGRSIYAVNFVSNDPENRGWTSKSSRKSKDFEGASFVASNDSLAVINVWKRPSLLSQKFTTEIVGLNLVTGRRVFRLTPGKDDLAVRWFTGAIVGDEIIVSGVSMGKSGKIYTASPEGVNLLRLDLDGNVKQREMITLATDLDPYFETNKSGKVSGMGNIFLHDVGMSTDGELLVAGEFYKTFNGGVTARDGLLLHIGADFKLQDAALVLKGKTNDGKGLGMTLNGGISLAKKSTVAAVAAAKGTFDFAFLEESGDLLTTAYFAGRKQVKKEKKLSLYVNTLADGEINTELISFDAGSDRVVTLPAKPGYVMVVEYDYDAKQLDIHLERLSL